MTLIARGCRRAIKTGSRAPDTRTAGRRPQRRRRRGGAQELRPPSTAGAHDPRPIGRGKPAESRVTARTVSGRIPIRLEPVARRIIGRVARRIRAAPARLDRGPRQGAGDSDRRFRRLARAEARACPARPRSGADRGAGRRDRPRARSRRCGSGSPLRPPDRPAAGNEHPRCARARTLRWSRFCPSCLREGGGRWLAAWRLPWYLACPVHHTMLATRCPHCAAPQRDRGTTQRPCR